MQVNAGPQQQVGQTIDRQLVDINENVLMVGQRGVIQGHLHHKDHLEELVNLDIGK